jgi:hypothetical protein
MAGWHLSEQASQVAATLPPADDAGGAGSEAEPRHITEEGPVG